MKLTVLDMTQSILSGLSSDEVNSISDTTESLQVAEILKQTYYNIISRVNIPNHTQFIQLDPSIDEAVPVLMYVPEGISSVQWLKYYNTNINTDADSTGLHDINTDIAATVNWTTTSTTSITIGLGTQTFTVASSGLDISTGDIATAVSGANSMTGTVVSYVGTTLILTITSITGSGTLATWTISSTSSVNPIPGYQYVTILPITKFVEMINSYNPQDTNVETFTFSDTSNSYSGNFTFLYRDDKQPQYCTILSNYYVIFDSFDNTQDSTLQGSKTMALGEVIPVWRMEDDFIPNLPDEQFQLLLNEAKSLAFFELKQMVHTKAEQEAKRGWTKVQRSKNTIDRPTDFDALPDFGRRGGYYTNTWRNSNGQYYPY